MEVFGLLPFLTIKSSFTAEDKWGFLLIREIDSSSQLTSSKRRLMSEILA